jgi:hypothetical protein
VHLLPLETGADSNLIGKNEKSESFHFILVQHYAFDYDVKRNSIHADALTAQNFSLSVVVLLLLSSTSGPFPAY